MEQETKDKLTETFFTKLLSGSAKESSKRFLAIFTVVILGSVITGVALYKGVDYIILLLTWLGFAAALLGMSEYNKNRQKKHDAATEQERIRAERLIKEDEIDSQSGTDRETQP